MLSLIPMLVTATEYKYAGEFLRLGAGARAAGMGDAVTPLIDDATATYWNPAGLALLRKRELTFMHAEQFGDAINYDVVSYGIPVPGVGGIGITLLRLGIEGKIAHTSLADTSRPISADNPTLIDTYLSNSDYALLLGHGLNFKELNIQTGITIKLIRREIGTYYAHGIGADMGVQYSFGAPLRYALSPNRKNYTIALTINDVTGTLIAWNNGTRDYVTPSVKLGGSITAWFETFKGNLTLTGIYCPDALFTQLYPVNDSSPIEHYLLNPLIVGGIGLEYSFRHAIFIRTGTFQRDITAGLGMRIGWLGIDYAFSMYNVFEDQSLRDDLEQTHRVSGSIRF